MSDPPHRVHHINESRVIELIEHSFAKRDLLFREEIRGVISSTVVETLLRLGIRADQPTEMQKDFAHNHDSRVKKDRRSANMEFVAIGAICSALLFVLGLGIRAWIEGQ